MKIKLDCPHCGADVNLDEDATIFRCAYCASTLKPTGRKEVQSFCILPGASKALVGEALQNVLQRKVRHFVADGSRLIYAPYWRVHGMLFEWSFGRMFPKDQDRDHFEYFKSLRAVPYERTFPAFSFPSWEVSSLGLKSQLLTLHPFSREKMGEETLIVEAEIDYEEAVEKALDIPVSYPQLGMGRQEVDLIRKGLIGETYALIYYPFYCFDMRDGNETTAMVVDGVSHRLVKGVIPTEQRMETSKEYQSPYRPMDFIPFRCPHCGWDLPFRPFSWVHLCANCGKAWYEEGGSFKPCPFLIGRKAKSRHQGLLYLPFWKLTMAFVAQGTEYVSLRDFYRLFPQPMVMAEAHLSQRPIHFYIPAFRTRNVSSVDKFATQVARKQPVLEEVTMEDVNRIRTVDVWLPWKEAVEMASLLPCSMTPKGAHKKIENVVFMPKNRSLVFLPFQQKGHFLREISTDFAIEKNALIRD